MTAGARLLALAGLAILCGCARPAPAEVAACGRLKSLKLDHTEILSARAMPANNGFSFVRALIRVPFLPQPASCRVSGVLRPTPDSDIRFEVWLPAKGDWNGRLQGIGNGGFAGSIDRMSLAVALHRGDAGAATDTGHQAKDTDAAWALGHPQRVIDFGYRAIHETAVTAKALIAAYYGHGPAHAYFGSVSNGGREALIEAQRYPQDYDGVLAGAPALDPAAAVTAAAFNQQLISTQAGWISPAKLKTVGAAVMRACDQIDGVADGLIDDPRTCRFQPETLACHGADNNQCLTPPQIASLKRIYAGPANGGYPGGYARGGEPGLAAWVVGARPGQALERVFSSAYIRNLVYGDANWDPRRFDTARDGPAIQRALAPLAATNPDLSAFKARGGKLILFHGWNDPALEPQATIDYFEAIRSRMGGAQTADFVRLYMVPGMEHGFGGPGPNAFGQLPAGGTGNPHSDMNTALMVWVEQGVAPGAIAAGKYKSDIRPLIAAGSIWPRRTRPLCPYPQVARWTGKGSTDVAANFQCVTAAP